MDYQREEKKGKLLLLMDVVVTEPEEAEWEENWGDI